MGQTSIEDDAGCAMLTPEKSSAATTLYDETVAMYEAAKAEFEATTKTFQDRVRSGSVPSASDIVEEESARARLFFTSVQLSRRQRGD